jgi:hypothetical protein
MRNKILISTAFLMLFPMLAFGYNISFNQLESAETNYVDFFKTILQGILNLIALLAILFIVVAGVIYLIASTSGNDALIGTAKKIWAGALIGLALSVAAPTFINEIIDIIGGEISHDLDTAPTLSTIIKNTLSLLLSIVGILAIIGMIINSIFLLTAGGDSGRAERAKKGFNISLLGLLVAGSSLILVRLIVDLIQG